MTIRFTQPIQFGARPQLVFVQPTADADRNHPWLGWTCTKRGGCYEFVHATTGRFWRVPEALCVVEGTLDEVGSGAVSGGTFAPGDDRQKQQRGKR